MCILKDRGFLHANSILVPPNFLRGSNFLMSGLCGRTRARLRIELTRIELTSEKEQIFVSLVKILAALALFNIMLVPSFN